MNNILIFLLSALVSSIITFTYFFYITPFLDSPYFIIPFSLNDFDLKSNIFLFENLKILYKFLTFYFFFVISFSTFSKIIRFSGINSNKKLSSFSNKRSHDIKKDSSLNLLIGYKDKQPVYLSEKGLYQNILVIGSIGTGKTSSSMYPFTEQLLQYFSCFPIGILILDVKGNYSSYVKSLTKSYKINKYLEIALENDIYYNPLDKPDLSAQVLANRLKTILELFSNNKDDSYWLDKCETTIAHAIVLIRLYNSNYVTFLELHKFIFDKSYYYKKIDTLKNLFSKDFFSSDDVFMLKNSLDYFNNEFYSLDERTINIIKSEIGRITTHFTNDLSIIKIFCPPKGKNKRNILHDVVNNGGVITLNIKFSKYANLTKIIATYLKLDFQNEILNKLNYSGKANIPTAFICDEYDKFATKNDGDFFSLSREAKCLNLICTQSFSSIAQNIENKNTRNVIIQNLVNKIIYKTDDILTIEELQKLFGKKYKKITNTSISENSDNTHYSFLLNSFTNKKSNLSESISENLSLEYLYDTNYFSISLKTFEALCYLTDGTQMISSEKLKMIPYFRKEH